MLSDRKIFNDTVVSLGHFASDSWASCFYVDPVDSKGNYSATSDNTKLVHWPLMGGLLHVVQRGGAWGGLRPRPVPSSLYQMYQLTHQRPVYQSLYCYYDGPLLCGFNVVIKGLN